MPTTQTYQSIRCWFSFPTSDSSFLPILSVCFSRQRCRTFLLHGSDYQIEVMSFSPVSWVQYSDQSPISPDCFHILVFCTCEFFLYHFIISETNNQDCLYRLLDVRGNAANLENRTIRFLHTVVAANVNKLLIWIAAPDFMWKLSFLLSKERFSSHEANGLNLPPFLRKAFPPLTARCVYEIRDWVRGKTVNWTRWFAPYGLTRHSMDEKEVPLAGLSSQNAINSLLPLYNSNKQLNIAFNTEKFRTKI